jgi:ABC-type multidrug transport system fused ATPase/permease subunit
MSTWKYAKKAMGFAKPYWPYIVTAMVLMLVTTSAQILLPNFQGRILDRVYAKDVDGFWTLIYYYIVTSAVIALFGVGKGLCFGIASRKMTNLVKNRLYRSIVTQVSFYVKTCAFCCFNNEIRILHTLMAPILAI